MDPLKHWQGEFGSEYIERNSLNEETTRQSAAVFQRILDASCARDVKSVLEIGANIGINLAALCRSLGHEVELAGLEPNASALERLKGSAELGLTRTFHSDAAHIPAPDGSLTSRPLPRPAWTALEARIRGRLPGALPVAHAAPVRLHLAKRVPALR